MQKVLQRTAAAKRQAARRAEQQGQLVAKAKDWTARKNIEHRSQIQSKYFLQEKQRRRSEYDAGPLLAPRQDVGLNAAQYGTADSVIVQAPRQAWKKYRHHISPFAVGDRVVMTKGRDAGKIGTISALELEAAACRVEGMNTADVFIPEYMRVEQSDARTIAPYALPIPWENLRLVFPLRDQSTGHFEDTILDTVVIKNASWSSKTGEYHRGQRFLPGTKMALPWPAELEPDKDSGHDDDTLRIDVDESTHRPYLLQPPMPPTVIDELRNKYSLFRDRHEPEYIAAKTAQELAERRKELLSRIVSTPLAELKEKKRQERLDQPLTLSEEQLARIGEVMAQEKVNATAKVAQRQQ